MLDWNRKGKPFCKVCFYSLSLFRISIGKRLSDTSHSVGTFDQKGLVKCHHSYRNFLSPGEPGLFIIVWKFDFTLQFLRYNLTKLLEIPPSETSVWFEFCNDSILSRKLLHETSSILNRSPILQTYFDLYSSLNLEKYCNRKYHWTFLTSLNWNAVKIKSGFWPAACVEIINMAEVTWHLSLAEDQLTFSPFSLAKSPCPSPLSPPPKMPAI